MAHNIWWIPCLSPLQINSYTHSSFLLFDHPSFNFLICAFLPFTVLILILATFLYLIKKNFPSFVLLFLLCWFPHAWSWVVKYLWANSPYWATMVTSGDPALLPGMQIRFHMSPALPNLQPKLLWCTASVLTEKLQKDEGWRARRGCIMSKFQTVLCAGRHGTLPPLVT